VFILSLFRRVCKYSTYRGRLRWLLCG